MKVLVCGPRVWLEQKPIEDALRNFPKGTILVHGAADGADTIADFVGKNLGFEIRAYPVDEALDGPWPAAGVRRNLRMLDAEHPSAADGTYVDIGLAFKPAEILTRGTGSMVAFMRKAQPSIDVRELLHRGRTRSRRW